MDRAEFERYLLPADAPFEAIQVLIVAALKEARVAAIEDAGDLTKFHLHAEADPDWTITLRAVNLGRTAYGYVPFPDVETYQRWDAVWSGSDAIE